MSRLTVAAEITGYATWFFLAWALLNRLVTLAARTESEIRRYRNARRLEHWKPRHRPRDPGDDTTRVLPAIQRPKGP